MKTQRLFFLALCTVLCLVILTILYASSPLSKNIYRASFDRKFAPDSFLKLNSILNIKYNSFYIAGISNSKIYLGNLTAPALILTTNKILGDSQSIKVKIMLDSVKEPRRFRAAVDSPYFYLTHGTMPTILRGTTHDWVARPINTDSNYYFVEAVPMTKNSLALRSYSMNSKAYELAKKTNTTFTFAPALLEKQIDGLFCSDGMLHFDKSTSKLVYIYFYRNEFIVADTNMTLSYKGHTIDTFRTARIQISKIGKEEESMLSGPPIQINGTSYVSNNLLYVNSHLLARNEDENRFKSSSIIDVYDLTNGKYVGSFYVPKYLEHSVSSYAISNNKLYAIFDHYLVQYDLGSFVESFQKHQASFTPGTKSQE